MPSLSELQAGVVAAILGGDDTAAAHVRGAGLPPARRLAVYRNAVRVRLKDALADVYPALRRLVGDDCFDGMANEYLRRHPPREGWLQSFGEHMPGLSHPSSLQETSIRRTALRFFPGMPPATLGMRWATDFSSFLVIASRGRARNVPRRLAAMAQP